MTDLELIYLGLEAEKDYYQIESKQWQQVAREFAEKLAVVKHENELLRGVISETNH